MARITAFASLVLIAASMAAGRPLDIPGSGVSAAGDRDGNLQESSLSHGRGLLAQSDSAFNEATRRFPGKSIMVCKQCTAFGLTGIVEDDQQGDFHVWAFDTGSIVNNGDAGFDNWQFSGCFDRPNNDKLVNFHAC